MKQSSCELPLKVLLRLIFLMLLWPASTAVAFEVREYPVPTANSGIGHMAMGPDGSIWFSQVRKIGKISVSGEITEFPLPDGAGTPGLIVVGTDNNVWFSVFGSRLDQVGLLSTDGTFRFFDVQMTEDVATSLVSLAASRTDASIYFSTQGMSLSAACTSRGGIFKIIPDGTITMVSSSSAGHLIFSQGNFFFSNIKCNELLPTSDDLFKFSVGFPYKKLGSFGSVFSQIETIDGKVWALVGTGGVVAILQSEFPETKVLFPRFSSAKNLVEGATNQDFWFISNSSIVRAALDGGFNEYELGLGAPRSLLKGTDNTIWFNTRSTIYRLSPDRPGDPVITRSASYVRGAVAPDSLITIFGRSLANSTQTAGMLPLPLQLGAVRVFFRDSKGGIHQAPLLYVSPSQINCLVPADMPPGSASVEIDKSTDAAPPTGRTLIDPLAPAIFTADASGRGLAAAVALRVMPDGKQFYEAVSADKPIDLLAGGRVFLVLFGSGLKGQSDLNKVRFETIPNAGLTPSFVGAQGFFPGLDQINIPLPEFLAGKGPLSLTLVIQDALSERYSNTVNLPIK